MSIKKYAILVIMIIGVVSSKNVLCMNANNEKIYTIHLPVGVKSVIVAPCCSKIAYSVPEKVRIAYFGKNFSPKEFNYNVSCISFDHSSTYLALAIDGNEVKVINNEGTKTISLPYETNEQITVLRCDISGRQCLAGSDKGKLWCLKYDMHPQLLQDFNTVGIAPQSSVYNCRVSGCDVNGTSYAVAMNDQWLAGHMFAGDLKTTKKGWMDGTSFLKDVCFSSDGSLLAFCIDNTVLIYVTAILEKWKQELRKNNNIASSPVFEKAMKGMLKASVSYGQLYKSVVEKVVFHDDNEHIFAALNSGKIYYSEIKEKGQSKEVVDFGDTIKSLAFSNGKLGVASLQKAILYYLLQEK